MTYDTHPDSTASSGRSWRGGLRILLAILVVLSTLAPASVAAATTDRYDSQLQQQQPVDFDAPSTPALQEDDETNSTQDDENRTQNETANATPVTDASQVRITPDIPDEDYVGVQVAESDKVYNTSGGFVTFTLSRPVDAARITQDQASVDVLGGGTTIRVNYADGAAPRNSTSLYNLELYFPDGSEKSVDLYATDTAVSASTAIDPGWQPVIDYLTSASEKAGYGTAPGDVQKWIKDTEEAAQLFQNFWSEYISDYVTLKIAQALNPFQWVELISIIGILSIWWSRKFGWILKIQQLSMPISRLQREAARQKWERSRKAAAQHKLSDISDVGTNASRYWQSTLGIETVDDMIELCCKGIVAKDEHGDILHDENGEIVYAHNGVEDLLQVDPVTHRTLRENTWLKPLLVDPRLNAATALANIERVLRVAEKEYKRGNEVRQTRMQVEQLLEELKDERTTGGTASLDSRSTRTGMGTGTPAGGD